MEKENSINKMNRVGRPPKKKMRTSASIKDYLVKSEDVKPTRKDPEEDDGPPVEKKPIGAASEADEESDKEEGEYEVEKILDYAWDRPSESGLYLVKWLGYDASFNTWEPISNLDCDLKLKEFYNKRLSQREEATPSQKRSLEVPPDPRNGLEKVQAFVDRIFTPLCLSELEAFFQKNKEDPIKEWSDDRLARELDTTSNAKTKTTEKRIETLKQQLLLKQCRDTRRGQLERLKVWENEINAIAKDGTKIVVQNDFDFEGPPRHMKYIEVSKPAPGIIIPEDPPIGCECPDGACEVKTGDVCCPSIHGQMFAYNKFSRLRVDVGTPIYECNKTCKCGPKCYNRVVQKGRKIKLGIYKTENGCGWGVKAFDNIRQGAFVVEYVGEVITSEEAEERGKKYDAEGRTYLFDLDFNEGEANPYTIDAYAYGNVSHFINHSCDPNLSIFNVWIDCLDPNLPRLCLFARRDIVKGEQLTFDYAQQTTQNLDPETKMIVEATMATNGKKTASKTECRCGTAKCRKFLFG